MNERIRRRLELRRSNAAQPHRNRFREAKVAPPWDLDDMCVVEELDQEDNE